MLKTKYKLCTSTFFLDSEFGMVYGSGRSRNQLDQKQEVTVITFA